MRPTAFRRSFLTVLSLVVALGAAPARADEESVARILSALTDYSTLLKGCPQYKDLAEVHSCQDAAIPGAGAACPPLTPVEVSEPVAETCQVSLWDQIDVLLNANGVARLSTSARSDYSAVLRVSMTPKSSVANHLHNPTYSPAGTCAEKWIVRKDRMSGFWAVYKATKVSLSLPVPTNTGLVDAFVAEVNVKQGKAAAVSGLFCGWVTHEPGDRSCRPVGDKPPPGTGRACTSHGDCQGLPCGEWMCDQGQCRQVEAAPDGTPCAGGGKCKAGACTREF